MPHRWIISFLYTPQNKNYDCTDFLLFVFAYISKNLFCNDYSISDKIKYKFVKIAQRHVVCNPLGYVQHTETCDVVAFNENVLWTHRFLTEFVIFFVSNKRKYAAVLSDGSHRNCQNPLLVTL